MPTIAKTTYTAEPERRLEGQWQPCLPADADRWAVFRTHWFQKKRGQQRPSPKRKRLSVFYGPDAEACARNLVAHSLSLSKPKQKGLRPILYRSLTQEEWLKAQERP